MATTRTLEARLAAGMAGAGLAEFEVMVVLGSGLGAFAESLGGAHAVPFEEVDGMPRSGVPGHAGRFVLGDLAGTRVLAQQGRVHFYEGRHPDEVTASVRAAAALGARTLLLTNAAGCLEAEWAVPGLMRIEDHLNLQGRAPLRRAEQGRGAPYDVEVGAAIDAAAMAIDVPLWRGVYAAMLGPTYETPAEIRMLAKLGAQAVGMSTVAEASAGWATGMRVGAVSCLSNYAAGISTTPLNHEVVVEAGAQVAGDLVQLLTTTIAGLG